MLLADFRTRAPEWAVAPDAFIEAYLAAALKQIDPLVWVDGIDEGQFYLAMHLLAITPAGKTAGYSDKEGVSNYGKMYDRLVRQKAGGAYLL